MIGIQAIDYDLKLYKERRLIVWGSGNLGAEMASLSSLLGVTIFAFCDSDPSLWGTKREGIAIISPDTLKKWYDNQEHGEILVQIMVEGKDEEISAQLRGMDIDSYLHGKGILSMLRSRFRYGDSGKLRCLRLRELDSTFFMMIEPNMPKKMRVYPISPVAKTEKKSWNYKGKWTESLYYKGAVLEDRESHPFTCILNMTGEEKSIVGTIESIRLQKFYQVLVLHSEKRDMTDVKEALPKSVLISCEKKLTTVKETVDFVKGLPEIEHSYLTVLFAGDSFAEDFYDLAVSSIKQSGKKMLTSNELRLFNGRKTSPFYKKVMLYKNPSSHWLFRRMIILHQEKVETYLKGDYEWGDIHISSDFLYHAPFGKKENPSNKVKIIPYYLPQFHTFPENDEWWGKGFTEWTNTRRGVPMFEGHVQPHEPSEALGYYDIILDETMIPKQIQMAKDYGIYGFCLYHYWFSGKKLMEKPIERILRDKSLDFPFCICWANENWSRTWDGLDTEILLAHEKSVENDVNFIYDVIPILKDERYIKIDGAPMLMVYRPDFLSNAVEVVQRWREICGEHGIENINVSFVRNGNTKNVQVLGADCGMEFFPNQLNHFFPHPNDIQGLDEEFIGNIYDYQKMARAKINGIPHKSQVFPATMLSWDNTARKMERGNIFHNFSLEMYEEWLSSAIEETICMNAEEERYVFINAWNEWAEGAHLEPDLKYGMGYLEATKRAMNGEYFLSE